MIIQHTGPTFNIGPIRRFCGVITCAVLRFFYQDKIDPVFLHTKEVYKQKLLDDTIVVTMVTTALFLLFRRAATCVVKVTIAILPSKAWFSAVFLRGRATAARSMTFM